MPMYYKKKQTRHLTYPHPDSGPKKEGGPANDVATTGRFYFPIRKKNPNIDIYGKTYGQIKGELLKKRILFEDPEFPAEESALFFSGKRPNMMFEWKRPKDICDKPALFVGGASRFDIVQGELGDCWLLAAMASLSLHDNLLYRIIPKDQGFGRDYCGLFHFQFWQYGQWADVIIDDRLPTCKNQLIYLHSSEGNEFWSALLEKAYAKLNGSYESLKGGSVIEAMEDFTGGIGEIIELNTPPRNLFQVMKQSAKKNALMGCAIEGGGMVEARLPNGLICGHAYSVTGVETLNNGIQLVRVRNPWGQVEWNGSFSDKSPIWKTYAAERERLFAVARNDGEFWMSFKDFCSNFTKLEICNIGPEEGEGSGGVWVTSFHEGRWVRGCTAGGCRNFPDTFWINPQFRLELEEEDDDPDDDVVGCSFIVSLLQKNRRRQKAKGMGLLTIGFAIYKLTNPPPPGCQLKKDFFLYNASCARSKNFINLRENSERFKLPPGNYVIIPTTFQPNEEADFMVRVFTEKYSSTSPMDQQITAYKASGLHSPDPEDQQAQKQKLEGDEAAIAQAEEKFKLLFEELTGSDGEIDAYELQDICNAVIKKNARPGSFDGFGLEACRSMVAMMDVTQSGKLDYEEFKSLWVVVRKWISVFKEFDKDQSGYFDCYELRDALEHAGYTLSSRMYQILVIRYAGKNLKIDMDDFVLLAIRIETMFRSYEGYVNPADNLAALTLEEWLVTTMYS